MAGASRLFLIYYLFFVSLVANGQLKKARRTVTHEVQRFATKTSRIASRFTYKHVRATRAF